MDQERATQVISCPQLLVTKRRLLVEWLVIQRRLMAAQLEMMKRRLLAPVKKPATSQEAKVDLIIFYFL
jgi:hypothetical protein